jgi:sterol desaturase/sphingolipid hydroxylase (fatty acid hydroxylase superfamily)
MPTGFALLLASAITFGYIIYGLAHFIIHHARFKQPLLRRWAAAHHVHHYHPDSNFGVTTPLWDVLLGTRYVRQARVG